ncbi:MAG: hypothetical protein ACLU38_03035 [Dysosmobacter sp.]
MKGQKVQLRITEVNRARRRVVGSIRSGAADEARKAAQRAVWSNIEVGKRYTGTVKSMTSLRRVCGHRRRGRHGPHLRAVLEPHQEPRRDLQGWRHHGCVRHLL